MAKITPSQLITEIRGRISGGLAQMWRGRITLRRDHVPANRRRTLQQRTRTIIADLSGDWDGLTDAQRNLWENYADDLPTDMTGFNAFIRNNTVLLYADHPDLTQTLVPPSSPSAPYQPSGFTWTYDSETDRWKASWTTPNASGTYVQLFVSPQAVYSQRAQASFFLAATVVSTGLCIWVDASGYPSGQVMRARLRAVNTWGEASTWTTTLRAQKA